MMTERLETLARHRLNQQMPWVRTGGDEAVKRQRPGQSRTSLRLALAYLVQNPGLAELAGDMEEIADCDLQGVDIFLKLIDFCRKRPNMTTAQVMENLREHPAREHLGKLVVWELPGDANRQELEFSDSVTGIRLQWVEALLGRMPKIVEQSTDQRAQYLELQQRRQALKQSLQGVKD